MSLMLIILRLYYVYMAMVIKVIIDGVTINNSGQISRRENANDISDSTVSDSFNNSSVSPRDGEALRVNDVPLGFSHASPNDVEENFQAPAGHNSTRHRSSGYQREQREGLGESSGNPPSFHSTERPSQRQAASDARSTPFDAGNHGSSSTGIRPAPYPPKTPPHREQRTSRGPLCVRHDPYGEHHVHDGAQHPSSSEVRSTDNKPRKKAQRPEKSRRTKAKTTQPTSHGPSRPFTPTRSRYYRNTPPHRGQRMLRESLGVGHDPYDEYDVHYSAQHHPFSGVQSTDKGPSKKARLSRSRNTHPTSNVPSRSFTSTHSLYESRSTSTSPSMLHSPVASHFVPASQCSSPSCSCARYQLSPPPNPSNHAPSGTPFPIPHGQYWAIPAHPDPHVTHMIAAHYLPHSQPFHFLIAHLVHYYFTALLHSPEPRFAPIPIPPPVSGPAPFIHQPSESPFRPHYPDSDPNTPTRDASYDHTSTAAIGSMRHPTAQTPSSSNLSQFAAHTLSWRHEGPSRMSVTPHPAAQTPSSSNLSQFSAPTPSWRHAGPPRMSMTPHPAAQTLPSSNFPQFAAHTPSWRHEGPSRMGVTPCEADSCFPMSPTGNHGRQHRTTRNASVTDEPEPVIKWARRE